MSSQGVTFIAAYSARSRAYAQAIQQAGLELETVVLYGDSDLDTRTAVSLTNNTPIDGLFTPDLSIPLRETCAQAGWRIQQIASNDINSDELFNCVASLDSALFIFSGYSGQIVKAPLINGGFNLLHVHAGWLPEYRGSTTIYYSWLLDGRCGVSALLLDNGIDTGPIIARQHYPAPSANIDVDVLYDNTLRADLLVNVLRTYFDHGELPSVEATGEEQTFYVIHPVLKHLALLSTPNPPRKQK